MNIETFVGIAFALLMLCLPIGFYLHQREQDRKAEERQYYMKHNDYLHKDSDYLFSLNKFIGKKVVDVIGYPADPFGGIPLFQITQIVFEDGTTVHVEGEHDTPYLPADDTLNNMDEKTLQKFIGEDEEQP